MKSNVLVAGLIITTLILSYAGWAASRWVNYALSYESQVVGTVCEMVKPEYLKTPEECN